MAIQEGIMAIQEGMMVKETIVKWEISPYHRSSFSISPLSLTKNNNEKNSIKNKKEQVMGTADQFMPLG